MCMRAQSLSCLTLHNPMDCSPPGSPSMGFSRQEYWSGLPFPPLGDLPNPGIKLNISCIAGGFFTAEPPKKPHNITDCVAYKQQKFIPYSFGG